MAHQFYKVQSERVDWKTRNRITEVRVMEGRAEGHALVRIFGIGQFYNSVPQWPLPDTYKLLGTASKEETIEQFLSYGHSREFALEEMLKVKRARGDERRIHSI